MQKSIPPLEEAIQGLLDRFSDEEHDARHEIDEIVEGLRNADVVARMPDEVLRQLLQLASEGVFPEDVAAAIERELNRRAKR